MRLLGSDTSVPRSRLRWLFLRVAVAAYTLESARLTWQWTGALWYPFRIEVRDEGMFDVYISSTGTWLGRNRMPLSLYEPIYLIVVGLIFLFCAWFTRTVRRDMAPGAVWRAMEKVILLFILGLILLGVATLFVPALQ